MEWKRRIIAATTLSLKWFGTKVAFIFLGGSLGAMGGCLYLHQWTSAALWGACACIWAANIYTDRRHQAFMTRFQAISEEAAKLEVRTERLLASIAGKTEAPRKWSSH